MSNILYMWQSRTTHKRQEDLDELINGDWMETDEQHEGDLVVEFEGEYTTSQQGQKACWT